MFSEQTSLQPFSGRRPSCQRLSNSSMLKWDVDAIVRQLTFEGIYTSFEGIYASFGGDYAGEAMPHIL